MKIITSAICLCLISAAVFAQETKLVITTYENSKNTREHYYVLTTNNNIKQGEYIQYYDMDLKQYKKMHAPENIADSIISSTGNYKMGKKDGTWIDYFPPYILSSHDTLIIKRGMIKNKGDYKDNKKVGVWLSYKENGLVLTRFDYDANKPLPPVIEVIFRKRPEWSGLATVSYDITDSCTVRNIVIVKSISPDCDAEVKRGINVFGELLRRYGTACKDSSVTQNIDFTTGTRE